MCGIVAAASRQDIVPVLIAGLHALEYRGYDSAGLAVLVDGQLQRLRALGKVRELDARQAESPLRGHTGIAHTRWATHGEPSELNAHPLVSGDIAIVHNGIIENHDALHAELAAAGFHFESGTDSEVIAHLVQAELRACGDLAEAVRRAGNRLHGAYAIAVIDATRPGHVIGTRQGSPLLVGIGNGENFLASDVQALIRSTRQFMHLEDGDVVEIEPDRLTVRDIDGVEVQRKTFQSELSADAVERGEYRHYMLKEIFEQPRAVADTLEGRIAGSNILPNIFGVDAEGILAKVRHVHIVACGTSYHAGLVARHWIETFAGLPCDVDVASEYRYRTPVVPEGTLFLAVSQSGETADTLAALRDGGRRSYVGALAICNVPESSLVRESQLVLMTRAGPEIGVASTKAFTTQLAALALFALELARLNGMDEVHLERLVGELASLPRMLDEALQLAPQIEELAERFVHKDHALFLGRGVHFPIALEGALKLKEISYIHAEAYPAGELKHGPLALVDKDMPVIAVAPNNQLFEKLKSNLEEVRARGGELFVFADTDSAIVADPERGAVIRVESGSGELIAPIVFTIPLQLLAYYVAVLRGTDVDQPRNLAKSVTVE